VGSVASPVNGPMLSRSRQYMYDPYDETPPGAPNHGTHHGKRNARQWAKMARRVTRRREGQAWHREQRRDTYDD